MSQESDEELRFPLCMTEVTIVHDRNILLTQCHAGIKVNPF